MTVLDWQTCLIALAALAATLFVIGYTVLAHWWRTAFGRCLFVEVLSIATLLDIALAAHWLHFIVPPPVATSVYTLIAVGQVYLVWMLAHTQILQRRARSDP